MRLTYADRATRSCSSDAPQEGNRCFRAGQDVLLRSERETPMKELEVLVGTGCHRLSRTFSC